LQEIQFNPAIECRNHQRKATGHLITSFRSNNPPVFPGAKENKHEAGRTKKLAPAQETKEAPCNEEIHGGEEIKGEW
jgi:hypothetical protein